MANIVDPDQTAPIGAVCSASTLFASILNSSVMLGNYVQQKTAADNFFRFIFFLALYGSYYITEFLEQMPWTFLTVWKSKHVLSLKTISTNATIRTVRTLISTP